MLIPEHHRWDLSPREAIELQTQLAARILLKDDPGDIHLVAGVDMSLDKRANTGFAGIIVFDYPSLNEVERVSASGPLSFPYIPGLLSFREGPLLLKAFEKLVNIPDVILFDGQGIAHPRRLGIASHLGLILDRPSIGCGKSHLYGDYEEPAEQRGDRMPLRAPDTKAVLGAVLRTKDRVNPLFISPGHRISQRRAVEIVLDCCDGYRIPKPTRWADDWVAKIKC